MTQLGRALTRGLALVAASLAAALGSPALVSTQPEQPESSPAPDNLPDLPPYPGPPTNPDALSPDVTARLSALSPADPRAYFLLGEELAAEAAGPRSEALARTLYVLAFELDRRRRESGAAGDPGLAASACLALADLSRLEEDRRWLVALARSIDRRYASPDWSRAAQPTYSGEAGFQAAEFLGLVRSGDGHRARNLRDNAEVAHVLTEYERMVGGLGSSGMLHEVEQQSRQWPCVQCGNLRIATLGETIPPRKGLCPTCHGNPGPILTRSQLIGQLRFESGLLDGIQTSWSAQMTLDQGAPLREPSAGELAPTMGVDGDAAYWRNGAWAKTPTGTPAPAPRRAGPPPVEPGEAASSSRP